jgi:hypothetical protein
MAPTREISPTGSKIFVHEAQPPGATAMRWRLQIILFSSQLPPIPRYGAHAIYYVIAIYSVQLPKQKGTWTTASGTPIGHFVMRAAAHMALARRASLEFHPRSRLNQAQNVVRAAGRQVSFLAMATIRSWHFAHAKSPIWHFADNAFVP